MLILSLGITSCYYRKGILASVRRIFYRIKRCLPADEKNLEESTSDMLVLKYAAVKMATCNFSNDEKLGEGWIWLSIQG
ncbi:hypothetical protein QN277_026399 [Acacia crassicarpa]|uniref:Uncharacterized protein n=1 Tax=Acacia crassicarpa TaxID=499986 RepID=A0AAE1JC21_9FABA|nr:hypothetical protein QN277_026399 [Acacia crassicarpa]